MNTTSQSAKTIDRQWHLIDIKGQTLGRASTQIAQLLIGKNKATYTPNIDNGDYVVVINSDDLTVTGQKLSDKIYYRHSGFRNGLRQETLGELMERDSRKAVERAVKGMLPKNKLQDVRLARLKVFKNATHPYFKHFSK